MERLTALIRSPSCSTSAWIAGGEALALGILRAAGDGELEIWAADLADTMVGALLRVLERSVNEAPVEERIRLAQAAVVLSIARPHCTSVLDGAVDAWIGWTPERAAPRHGDETLATWTLLYLLRENLDEAAHAAWCLAGVDQAAIGMILHDWAVARIQAHGADREVQCFHALRASLSVSQDSRPGLLLVAAAVAVKAGGCKRRMVMPWLDDMARELARDGTARATPVRAARR